MCLMVAVLQAMIEDIKGECAFRWGSEYKEARERNLRTAAKQYLHSPSVTPFSFLWICDQLDIDPSYIRGAERDGSMLNWVRVKPNDGGPSFYNLVRR